MTEECISTYDQVRLDISRHGNKSVISNIFSNNLDSDSARRSLKFWRTKALYEFDWIVPFYETFELMIRDFQNITTFATNIVKLINKDNSSVHNSFKNSFWNDYSEMESMILFEDSQKVTIDELFDSLYEAFDAINLFFGNRREVPYILDQFLLAIKQLDIHQILNEAQLEFELIDMFKEATISQKSRMEDGWDIVVRFFQDEFRFSESETEVMSHLRARVSELFSIMGDDGGGDNSTLIRCDPEKLSAYLILPPSPPSPDEDSPSLVTIDTKLCNMTAIEKWTLFPILFEEFRLEEFLNLYLKIDIQTILDASNVTEEEAKMAVSAMQDGYEAYGTLADNFFHLSDLFTNASYEYENQTLVEKASSFMCGKKDEFVIGNFDLNNIFNDAENDNESIEKIELHKHNSNQINGNAWRALYKEYKGKEDSCSSFIKTLNQTEEGEFLWQYIGHIVRGKVLYSPVNNFTMSLMEEANKTFIEIGRNIDRITNFAILGDQLDTLRTMQDDLEIIQELCQNSTIREILIDYGVNETAIDFLVEFDIDSLIEYLEENKDVYTSDLQMFVDFLACVSTTDRFVGVNNETEILNWAVNATEISGDGFFAGIAFMDQGNNTKHVKYKLKMEKGKHANTYQIRSPYYIAGPESGFFGNLGYMVGFIQIQELVDRAIIKVAQKMINAIETIEKPFSNIFYSILDYSMGNSQSNVNFTSLESKAWNDYDHVGIFTQEFPYPCYTVDWFLNQMYLSNALQICFLFAYLAFIISNTRQQLWEKESQNSDIMQAMGMQPRVIWLVWLVMCLTNIAILTTVIVLLMKYGPFLPRSNPIIVWITFFIVGIGTIMYCFMMCAIMKRTATGSILTAVCHVFSFIPYVILLLMKVLFLNCILCAWHVSIKSLRINSILA